MGKKWIVGRSIYPPQWPAYVVEDYEKMAIYKEAENLRRKKKELEKNLGCNHPQIAVFRDPAKALVGFRCTLCGGYMRLACEHSGLWRSVACNDCVDKAKIAPVLVEKFSKWVKEQHESKLRDLEDSLRYLMEVRIGNNLWDRIRFFFLGWARINVLTFNKSFNTVENSGQYFYWGYRRIIATMSPDVHKWERRE